MCRFRQQFVIRRFCRDALGILLAVAALTAVPVRAQLQGEAASLLTRDGVTINVPNTCNSVVFAQVPGHPDYFLGRILGKGGVCPVPQHPLASIALFRMNWNAHTLDLRKEVFQPFTVISAGARSATVRRAYDPSVALYDGELWVAFECATDYTSACIGPFDWKTASIDPRRTTEVVQGTDADPRSAYLYAAAVPNIFVLHQQLYLYWSAIKIERATGVWQQVTIRGIQLAQERSGLRRIWALGAIGVPVASHDPARNVEVLGLNPSDSYSNQTADVKGVYVDQKYVYVIASLGGKGPAGRSTCLNPRGTGYGCWRMQIFRSSSPLGKDVFNLHPLDSPALPLNPADYQRPFVAPDGILRILGIFYNPQERYPNAPYFIASGRLISYPFPMSQLPFR